MLTVVFEFLPAEEHLPFGGGFTTTILFLDKSDSLGAFNTLKSDTAEVEEFLSSLITSMQSWSAEATTPQSWSSLTLSSSPLLYYESDVSDSMHAATELAWHSAMPHRTARGCRC